MAKILIIGGGIIGTMHAWQAIKSGHEVVQLERDSIPRSASVRNFGLVWVSGRASGAELAEAIRARELWDELAHGYSKIKFRANGSLTIARTEAEIAVMQDSLVKADAADRHWQLLDPQETRKINPAIRGNFKASLWCPLDAVVEPGEILESVRAGLTQSERYDFQLNKDVIDVTESSDSVRVICRDGSVEEADLVILCPGADHFSLFADFYERAPLRRVRLQMMSTERYDETITTSIADGDSLRYYPAYDVASLSELPPQHPVAAAEKMQLLLVQRADGTLTIGDTHEYDEPFNFKLREDAYQYLAEVATEILGRSIGDITHRWDGIYSQRTDGAICDRRWISSRIISVTGPGGRGNSLSPAIAESTFKEIQL